MKALEHKIISKKDREAIVTLITTLSSQGGNAIKRLKKL
jgi:hypothetical protein